MDHPRYFIKNIDTAHPHQCILPVWKIDPDVRLPSYGSKGSAGLDIYANEDGIIESGDFHTISTGIAVAIPNGRYGRIACRSSLACLGIDVLGGVIDSDYRGELKIMLINHNPTNSYEYKKYDRIAQMIIERCLCLEPVEMFTDRMIYETERGENGFGSTGV
jgi:dUTP pyrophosphatase